LPKYRQESRSRKAPARLSAHHGRVHPRVAVGSRLPGRPGPTSAGAGLPAARYGPAAGRREPPGAGFANSGEDRRRFSPRVLPQPRSTRIAPPAGGALLAHRETGEGERRLSQADQDLPAAHRRLSAGAGGPLLLSPVSR